MNADPVKTWQRINDRLWVFGTMLRGVVRQPIAEVRQGWLGTGWHWYIPPHLLGGGKFPCNHGTANELHEAVVICEQRLVMADISLTQ